MGISGSWLDNLGADRMLDPLQRVQQPGEQDRDKPSTPRRFDISAFALAAKLRKLRERLHMSQEVFAATYGLQLVDLQQWESGQAMPSDEQIAYILEIERDPEATRKIPPE